MKPSNPVRKSTAKQFMAGANVKGTETVNEPSKKAASPVEKTTYVRKSAGTNSGNLPQKRTPDC